VIPKEQVIFITHVSNFLKTESGEQFLKYLRKVCHIEDTLEPEEVYNREMEASGLPHRTQIDPLAFAKRQGMKAAYYKIVALLKQGEREQEAK